MDRTWQTDGAGWLRDPANWDGSGALAPGDHLTIRMGMPVAAFDTLDMTVGLGSAGYVAPPQLVLIDSAIGRQGSVTTPSSWSRAVIQAVGSFVNEGTISLPSNGGHMTAPVSLTLNVNDLSIDGEVVQRGHFVNDGLISAVGSAWLTIMGSGPDGADPKVTMRNDGTIEARSYSTVLRTDLGGHGTVRLQDFGTSDGSSAGVLELTSEVTRVGAGETFDFHAGDLVIDSPQTMRFLATIADFGVTQAPPGIFGPGPGDAIMLHGFQAAEERFCGGRLTLTDAGGTEFALRFAGDLALSDFVFSVGAAGTVITPAARPDPNPHPENMIPPGMPRPDLPYAGSLATLFATAAEQPGGLAES